MATTGKINGTIIGLYKVVTGTPDTFTKIANGRSANFDLSVDMIETTEKDSGGFKEYIAGEKGGTFQFEGVLEYESSVLISGVSGSAPNNDVATFSCTMQMTGTITKGNVSA